MRNGRNLTIPSCRPAAKGGPQSLVWKTDFMGGLAEERREAEGLKRGDGGRTEK